MKKSQIKKALKIIKEQEETLQQMTAILNQLLATGDKCFGGSCADVIEARIAAEDAVYQLSINVEQHQNDCTDCFIED